MPTAMLTLLERNLMALHTSGSGVESMEQEGLRVFTLLMHGLELDSPSCPPILVSFRRLHACIHTRLSLHHTVPGLTVTSFEQH